MDISKSLFEYPIFRFNLIKQKIVCGTIYFFENQVVVYFKKDVYKKFIISNSVGYVRYRVRDTFDDFTDLLHIVEEEYWLNNFDRKEKKKKKREKKNRSVLNFETHFKNKNELKIEKEQKEKSIKENKLRIVKKAKNKLKLKIDIFEDSIGLGTMADLFSKNIIPEKDIIPNIYEEDIEVSKDKKKNKQLSNFYKINDINYDTLVLWDIENVNFYDDFSIITKLLDKNSLKVFSYSKKNYRKKIYLKGNNLNFVLKKLKKRGWIEKRTTKIADTKLIDEFNQRKKKIKKMILISADKDFLPICEEAIDLGINVEIWNIESKNQFSWFRDINYNYKFLKY